LPTAKEGAELSPGQDFKLPNENFGIISGGLSAGFYFESKYSLDYRSEHELPRKPTGLAEGDLFF
jgi:hypothetical protein